MDRDRYQLWSQSIGRQDLVELLDGRHPSPERTSIYELSSHGGGLKAVWTGEERCRLSPFPVVIVGGQDELEDLVAWSSTYLRSLGPLGAITRMITPDRFERLIHGELPSRPWRLAAGAVGLIIGEILAQLGTTDVLSAAGANPVGTLSFAIFRAWSLGISSSDLSEVSMNYGVLMQIVQRKLDPRRLRDIDGIAACLTGHRVPDSYSHRMLSELVAGADVYSVASDVLRRSTDLLNTGTTANLAEMTAEAKVQFFDAIAPSLVNLENGADELEAAFALALAAFICRPGMEQQVGLLGDYVKRMPAALLWLGALQSLAAINDVLSLADGAGWRIAREVFRPEDPVSPPRADVSLGEMIVFARNRSKAFERLISRPRLDIEIYPMITTGLRGGSRQVDQPPHREAEDRRLETSVIKSVESKLEQALGMLKEFSGGPITGKKIPVKRRR